jgi:putative endonuclease
MAERSFYVYTMTSRNGRAMYTGMTNDLARRVWQHRHGSVEGFAARYHVTRLV